MKCRQESLPFAEMMYYTVLLTGQTARCGMMTVGARMAPAHKFWTALKYTIKNQFYVKLVEKKIKLKKKCSHRIVVVES